VPLLFPDVKVNGKPIGEDINPEQEEEII